MNKKTYEVGKAALVVVEHCAGSVVVKGYGETSIAVRGDHEATESDGGLAIRAEDSLVIRMPPSVALRLQEVTGNAVVKGVEGELWVDNVQANCALKRVQAVTVGAIGGDLAARAVNGPLTVAEVEGDAALRDVRAVTVKNVHGDLVIRSANGDVQVEQVDGDLQVRNARGALTVETCWRDANLRGIDGQVTVRAVQGDIRLRGALPAGKHHLRAEGDIVVRWPAGEPLNVEVTAQEIRNRLPLVILKESPGYLSGHLGEEETTLVLEAGGRALLRETTGDEEWAGSFHTVPGELAAEMEALGEELAGLGDQLTGKVEAHMSELSARLETQYGAEFAQKIAERAARKTEHAVRRAMRQSERALRRASAWAPPPADATANSSASRKRAQASAEEQMKILSMLEKGTISVEEANTLLKALES